MRSESPQEGVEKPEDKVISCRLCDDHEAFLWLYLENELFQEKKHEGSERDDLLLRWPWTVWPNTQKQKNDYV